MIGGEFEALTQLLARLPGLGRRSANRAALHLLVRRETLLVPLARALTTVAEQIRICSRCGTLDLTDPCGICADPARNPAQLCVVRDVADLWALEATHAYRGRYFVLGGLLSALDGVGPEDLGLDRLVGQASDGRVTEVILALPVTVDGQTTAHYLAERLSAAGVAASGLAHGMPVGGELDYLDHGTITAALAARRPVSD